VDYVSYIDEWDQEDGGRLDPPRGDSWPIGGRNFGEARRAGFGFNRTADAPPRSGFRPPGPSRPSNRPPPAAPMANSSRDSYQAITGYSVPFRSNTPGRIFPQGGAEPAGGRKQGPGPRPSGPPNSRPPPPSNREVSPLANIC
jgi:hypothetical protein